MPLLTQSVVAVLLNTTANDPLLPESTEELPPGSYPEDTTFEVHICDRVIINSMVNVLKGTRDPYIREHSFSASLYSLFHGGSSHFSCLLA